MGLRQQLTELQTQLAAAELQQQREASRAAQLASRLAEKKQQYKRQVADLQLQPTPQQLQRSGMPQPLPSDPQRVFGPHQTPGGQRRQR